MYPFSQKNNLIDNIMASLKRQMAGGGGK